MVRYKLSICSAECITSTGDNLTAVACEAWNLTKVHSQLLPAKLVNWNIVHFVSQKMIMKLLKQLSRLILLAVHDLVLDQLSEEYDFRMFDSIINFSTTKVYRHHLIIINMLSLSCITLLHEALHQASRKKELSVYSCTMSSSCSNFWNTRLIIMGFKNTVTRTKVYECPCKWPTLPCPGNSRHDARNVLAAAGTLKTLFLSSYNLK